MKYSKVEKCRICGNTHLECVLDLGEQALTGVFPRDKNTQLTAGPVRLVKCVGGDDVCGLLQMEHSYDLGEMYGENYGYRSGLNPSMVAHLHNKVIKILGIVSLDNEDLVIDIGSNDSTTLQAYPHGPTLVGIDPTGIKFHKYYPAHIQLIPDFFSSALLHKRFSGRKAKVITSFSMFYDLEAPLEFMGQVYDVLADDGVWVFEQSYMPTMLETNSYDTVCHEHLEFYALRQIKWMTDKVGFKIVDVEFNGVNGGSFSIVAAKTTSEFPEFSALSDLLKQEENLGLNTLAPYNAFAERVESTKKALRKFVEDARDQGKRVGCLGASTKGNVLLQYCSFTPNELYAVGEVNPEKYGCFTPGTLIPIIPESEMLADEPDYLIVLPWHFRDFFVKKYKFKKTRLVFPLPTLEIV